MKKNLGIIAHSVALGEPRKCCLESVVRSENFALCSRRLQAFVDDALKAALSEMAICTVGRMNAKTKRPHRS